MYSYSMISKYVVLSTSFLLLTRRTEGSQLPPPVILAEGRPCRHRPAPPPASIFSGAGIRAWVTFPISLSRAGQHLQRRRDPRLGHLSHLSLSDTRTLSSLPSLAATTGRAAALFVLSSPSPLPATSVSSRYAHPFSFLMLCETEHPKP